MNEEIKKLVGDIIYNNPLPLLTVQQSSPILDEINLLLPYSIGFEIECQPKEKLYRSIHEIAKEFRDIPYIRSSDFNSLGEIRFRIPNGIRGIFSLYCLTILLKRYAELNMGSGIHIHIDMSDGDYLSKIGDGFVNENSSWILEELDTWGYKGKYNTRGFRLVKGNWICIRDNTIEIRICEMTFDYSKLIKRFIHANQIVKKIKVLLTNENEVLSNISKINSDFDRVKILEFIKSNTDLNILKEQIQQNKNQLEEQLKSLRPIKNTTDINAIVKSRIKK